MVCLVIVGILGSYTAEIPDFVINPRVVINDNSFSVVGVYVIMSVLEEHYHSVRSHFQRLMGGKCVVCGTFFDLEFHHKQPCGLGANRGMSVRMWEWFDAYEADNLSLLCHDCHVRHHHKDVDVTHYYHNIKM